MKTDPNAYCNGDTTSTPAVAVFAADFSAEHRRRRIFFLTDSFAACLMQCCRTNETPLESGALPAGFPKSHFIMVPNALLHTHCIRDAVIAFCPTAAHSKSVSQRSDTTDPVWAFDWKAVLSERADFDSLTVAGCHLQIIPVRRGNACKEKRTGSIDTVRLSDEASAGLFAVASSLPFAKRFAVAD